MAYLNDYLGEHDYQGALNYLQLENAQSFEFGLKCYPAQANALIYASALGQKELVQIMLDKYAHFQNLDEKNAYGSSAFLVSVMQNQVDVMKLFLNYGVALDEQDLWKREALEVAVIFNANDALQHLLTLEKINKKAYSEPQLGESALVFNAVMHHHLAILDILLNDEYFFNLAPRALKKLKSNQFTQQALLLEVEIEKRMLERSISLKETKLINKI